MYLSVFLILLLFFSCRMDIYFHIYASSLFSHFYSVFHLPAFSYITILSLVFAFFSLSFPRCVAPFSSLSAGIAVCFACVVVPGTFGIVPRLFLLLFWCYICVAKEKQQKPAIDTFFFRSATVVSFSMTVMCCTHDPFSLLSCYCFGVIAFYV